PLEMPCSFTFKTTVSLRIYPIVPLCIRNVCVARTSAVASKVPYFVTLVALLVPLKMPCSFTFKTTVSLRIYPIVPLCIRNVCVARTSAVASKVPYFVTLVALLGTRAIVMKMALGALGQIPTVRLPLD
nr:hypothetical protein [Tanacetum cinerariifolium]